MYEWFQMLLLALLSLLQTMYVLSARLHVKLPIVIISPSFAFYKYYVMHEDDRQSR